MANDFMIGISPGTLVTLASLGIFEPLSSAAEISVDFDRADGMVSGLGWGTDKWSWAFLTLAQYNTLRTYIPKKSAEIYIKTLAPGKKPAVYRAIAIWPTHEQRAGGKVLDFSIEFRLLELIE